MQKIPSLVKLYADFKEKGLHVIGVEGERSKYAAVKTVVEEQKINYQVTMRGAHPDVTVSELPTGLLFDRSGVLVARNLKGEKLRGRIAELLAQPKPKNSPPIRKKE